MLRCRTLLRAGPPVGRRYILSICTFRRRYITAFGTGVKRWYGTPARPFGNVAHSHSGGLMAASDPATEATHDSSGDTPTEVTQPDPSDNLGRRGKRRGAKSRGGDGGVEDDSAQASESRRKRLTQRPQKTRKPSSRENQDPWSFFGMGGTQNREGEAEGSRGVENGGTHLRNQFLTQVGNRRSRRRNKVEGILDAVDTMLEADLKKQNKSSEGIVRRARERKLKERKKKPKEPLEEEILSQPVLDAKKRVLPNFLRDGVPPVAHGIHIIHRLSAILRFRLPPNESQRILKKLIQLKKDEEKMFEQLNLASFFVPKTMVALLSSVNIRDEAIEIYQKKSVRLKWPLVKVINSDMSLSEDPKTEPAAKPEVQGKEEGHLDNPKGESEWELDQFKEAKGGSTELKGKSLKPKKPHEKKLYLRDFSNLLKLTNSEAKRLAREIHNIRQKKKIQERNKQTRENSRRRYKDFVMKTKNIFMTFLEEDVPEISQDDRSFFYLHYQHLPVAEWYHKFSQHDCGPSKSAIDAAKRIAQVEKSFLSVVTLCDMLTECRKREAVLSRFAWWPGMSSNRLKGAVRARKMNPCQQDEGNYVRLEAYGRGEALRSWFVTKARADEYPFELERMQKAPSASGRESLIFLCRNKMNESLERIVSDEYDHLDPGLIMQAWEAINPEEVRSFLTTLISLVPSQYLARVLELSESLSSGHSTIHDVMKKIPFIKSTFRGSVYERIQRDTDIAVFEKLLGLYISMVNPIDLMSIHRDLFMGRYLSAFPVDKKQSTWQLHQWLKSSDDYRVQAAGRLPTYFQPYHPEADRVRDKTPVDCKVLIRNIDPNLTVYDIMAAFKHLGELDGVEVMKEQMQPSFRRLNFSNYQNLIKGSKKASIDIRMKWFSKVYGWLYFKNAEAAAKASSESIRFFGLSFPPLNSYIKKVRPNQKGVESVFKTKSQDITSAIQTCPASDVTELWVGNLRNATSVVEAECIIAETLAKKSLGGSLKVSHTFRMDDSVISPVGTGVARITFDSHSDANRAYRILNKSRILPATWSTTKT